MKFIHAHQMAKKTIRKPTSPCNRVRFSDRVMQPARGLRDRDDEDEVEEELERRGGPVVLVRRARGHPAVESRARDGACV